MVIVKTLLPNAADTLGDEFQILAAITPAWQLIELLGSVNGVSRVVEYELPSAETLSAPKWIGREQETDLFFNKDRGHG